jgi:tellurite resistance protein TerC
MASALPKEKQKMALRYGIIGAYAFRGICLLLVAWIVSNPWLKIFGAVYLIYLMCKNLVNNEEESPSGGGHVVKKSLLATIISIEVMDLSLSLDNVVAAVALDKRLWVVCLGVFIGILALRFVAGYCIRLIEKFPILQKTAFLLVGFVGVILLTEISLEYAHIHFHIDSFQKFVGIIGITAATLLYGHTAVGRKFLHPVVKGGMPVLRVLNTILGWVMLPFVGIIQGFKWLFSVKKTLAPEA